MNFTRFAIINSVIKQQIIKPQRRSCSDVTNLRIMKGFKHLKGKTIRCVSTCTVNNIQKEKSLVTSVLEKIPFLNVHKTRIKAAGYLLYEDIVDNIDYLTFFEKFGLVDTFYSWFVIIELHIWLLSARAMSDGADGRHLRNSLVEALWADVAQRVKKLGASNPAAMREHILLLSEQLQAALIAYDEGLQTNDMVLAGALWRRFYQAETADLVHLEQLVKYVRKHVTLLDNTPSDKLYRERKISWEPLEK